jgi:hypothetical protein
MPHLGVRPGMMDFGSGQGCNEFETNVAAQTSGTAVVMASGMAINLVIV